MSRPELTPIDFVLTPPERVQAAVIALHLERLRRERNARDERIKQARRERVA